MDAWQFPKLIAAAAGHYAAAVEVATRIGSPHWAVRACQALTPKTTR